MHVFDRLWQLPDSAPVIVCIFVIYNLVTTQSAQKIIPAVSNVFQKAVVNPLWSFNAVPCGLY